jgi:hypothetical protein
MLRVCVCAALLLWFTCARAELFEKWERTDSILLGTSLTTLAIDWGQTRDLARRQEPPFTEANPFLGKHPSVGRVDTYFAFVMAGTVGLSAVLPVTYRRWFLGGLTVLETAVIIDNHRLGLRVRF